MGRSNRPAGAFEKLVVWALLLIGCIAFWYFVVSFMAGGK